MRSIMLLALLAALSVCMPNAARAEGDLPTLTNYLSDELYQMAVPWENCDDSALAAGFGISSVPTVLILKKGKVVDQSLGFKPGPAVKSWIEGNI